MRFTSEQHAVAAHASAVRQAIHTARAANEQWQSLENATGAPAVTPVGEQVDMLTAAPVRTGAAPSRATFITVSPNDVMLALRVGTKLVVIDDVDNKNSDLVRAVDALLTRAKKMVDADGRKRVSIATNVENQPDTRIAIDVVPTAKGSETTMHYERGMTRERIEPVGPVNFFLG